MPSVSVDDLSSEGPGVSWPTATASISRESVSQPRWTTRSVREVLDHRQMIELGLVLPRLRCYSPTQFADSTLSMRASDPTFTPSRKAPAILDLRIRGMSGPLAATSRNAGGFHDRNFHRLPARRCARFSGSHDSADLPERHVRSLAGCPALVPFKRSSQIFERRFNSVRKVRRSLISRFTSMIFDLSNSRT